MAFCLFYNEIPFIFLASCIFNPRCYLLPSKESEPSATEEPFGGPDME